MENYQSHQPPLPPCDANNLEQAPRIKPIAFGDVAVDTFCLLLDVVACSSASQRSAA